jgi:electron transfer flavoprotein beta subunit
MGADEGLVIHCDSNLDSYGTAKALAKAIEQEGGATVIFTGKLAIDDNASAVGQMVAEFLKIPHTSVVSKFSYNNSSVEVHRDIEGGSKEVVQMQTPALVTANKGLNMPRYASLPGIMKAKKKTIKELDLAQLGVSEADIKVKMSNYSLPPEKPAVQMISGDSLAQATSLAQLLRNEAKVL